MLQKKIYNEIEIVFLVCGHTKNICDLMFELLKHKCHDQKIMTFPKLIDVLNFSPQVNCIETNRADFYEWDTFLENSIRNKEQEQ